VRAWAHGLASAASNENKAARKRIAVESGEMVERRGALRQQAAVRLRQAKAGLGLNPANPLHWRRGCRGGPLHRLARRGRR